VIARLRKYNWHITTTTKAPRVSRQQALAHLGDSLRDDRVRSWLVRAVEPTALLHPTSGPCGSTHECIDPAWLVQIPVAAVIDSGDGRTGSAVAGLYFVNATTGKTWGARPIPLG
jgi:hypothetical protein